jgi:hypothetical protein
LVGREGLAVMASSPSKRQFFPKIDTSQSFCRADRIAELPSLFSGRASNYYGLDAFYLGKPTSSLKKASYGRYGQITGESC